MVSAISLKKGFVRVSTDTPMTPRVPGGWPVCAGPNPQPGTPAIHRTRNIIPTQRAISILPASACGADCGTGPPRHRRLHQLPEAAAGKADGGEGVPHLPL